MNRLLISLCMLTQALSSLGITPAQSGGIYYAYDVTADSAATAPEGYRAVYVSHYGRHGSRWPVNRKIYQITSDFFQDQQLAQNLTDEGKQVWKQTTLCAGDAAGHMGELTPLGERQHRDIARRMARRWPALFADGKRVEARSSVEPRCIMSMAAFCEALKENCPGIRLQRHASPGDMDFIHPKTEKASQMNSDDAPWRWDFDPYRDSVAMCRSVAERLFKEVPDTAIMPQFMRSLYDIAISVQDIDGLEADLLPLFTPEQLEGIWKASNYVQYVGNGRSPLSGASGPEAVGALWKEIAERADEMLASGEVSADLRFGHDTDLLRLVSLLDLDGYGLETEDIEEAARHWPNWRIAPMGANLQMIFYRNDAGHVIVTIRLNERPARIAGMEESAPGFYDWENLKNKIGGLGFFS